MDEAKFEFGDHLTPLVITRVGPEPVPVPGTDRLTHLIYELIIFNVSARPATIASIATHADGPDGAQIATISAEEVVGASILLGDYNVPPEPASNVPSGGSTVVIMDAGFDSVSEVPRRLVHVISATFGELPRNQAPYAASFPEAITQVGGLVTVGSGPPTTIRPPLAGRNWLAANACGSMNPHRGAILPVGGRLNAAERYAIDWCRIDPQARPLIDPDTGMAATFSGDSSANESYFTWNQPVLAVGDGTIVTAIDEAPDATPQIITPGIPLDQLGRNRVVHQLAEGVYAFYAHLKPGSVTVREGDRVKAGQEIARSGNSGNTTEPHLHFHLMDSPYPLDADNLPFVISAFRYDGQFSPDGVTDEPSERRAELPFVNSVIDFPEVASVR